MDTKKIYCGVIAIVLILAIFGSWKFLFGFVVAVAIFWYFGEEKVKKAVKDVYRNTQNIAKDIQDKVVSKVEEIEVVISKSTIIPTDVIGWYQIVIIADGKSYLLKPLNVSLIPNELSVGKVIKIVSSYKRNGLDVEKKQTIEANGMIYKVTE